MKGGEKLELNDVEKVYIENAKSVYKYLLCLSHNAETAEELTQETFFQASKIITKFRGDCKVSVWLCQIAKRLWYKHLEKTKTESLSIDDCYDLTSNENIENEYGQREERIMLYRTIHLLEPKVREVVYLRLEEFSFKEIGEIVGQSENWARVNYYRAKQKISNLMKG